MPDAPPTAEVQRLEREAAREENWKRWGPYLSERQWGTVREDYSRDGTCWDYFTHDDARGRAYRWGEDGLLGWCDRECRLCFSVALWNGRDPFLKERIYGLTNSQGNHGEDPKELYHYLDATPTYSYAKALYKYPQTEFPYEKLLEESRRRGRDDAEYEIVETGVFDDGKYFDVAAEYAKAGADDILIKLTLTNRAAEAARLHLLPTLWFRNGWSWGCDHDGCFAKPSMRKVAAGTVECEQETLGKFTWHVEDDSVPLLFTENETDVAAVFGGERRQPYSKDAFHRYVVAGEDEAVNPEQSGTKAAAHFKLELAAGESRELRLRLVKANDDSGGEPFADFDTIFAQRQAEADDFYASLRPADAGDEEARVWRQAYAGLLWGKQFYHYVVRQWLDGDPAQPPPPAGRKENARNKTWKQLFNYDVLSVPDKWEFPWYAAWDLAFHMLPMARLDPAFAKGQLMLLLREWYMRPDGALPAYEFAFSDANPPVHAWACWRVYKMTGPRGRRDRVFLASCFHKLLLNFTWWVNKKDEAGKHVFGGGFLGLDNIGVFDRNDPPADGKIFEQADGTAWMAFYCVTMLSIALELASEDPSYEDIASKFFEHFAIITKAMNHLGGSGLWDDRDGFYYDQLYDPQTQTAEPVRVRSIAGLVPLMACAVFDADVIDRLPGFRKRMTWFLDNQEDLAQSVQFRERDGERMLLLSVAPRGRMAGVLDYVFDPKEFLSDFGVRSLSKHYGAEPFETTADGKTYRVAYEPGEATGKLFGGNSNWRGPIWFPLNYLLVEALERYGHFYGDAMQVAVPDCEGGGSAEMNLTNAAAEVQRRLVSIFLPGRDGDATRPVFRGPAEFRPPGEADEGNLLFFEYFDGDTGRGCGANHQTGWTSLVALCVENQCRNRAGGPDGDEEAHGVDLGEAE